RSIEAGLADAPPVAVGADTTTATSTGVVVALEAAPADGASVLAASSIVDGVVFAVPVTVGGGRTTARSTLGGLTSPLAALSGAGADTRRAIVSERAPWYAAYAS